MTPQNPWQQAYTELSSNSPMADENSWLWRNEKEAVVVSIPATKVPTQERKA